MVFVIHPWIQADRIGLQDIGNNIKVSIMDVIKLVTFTGLSKTGLNDPIESFVHTKATGVKSGLGINCNKVQQYFTNSRRIETIFRIDLAKGQPPSTLANIRPHQYACCEQFLSAAIRLQNLCVCPKLSRLMFLMFP